MEGHRFLRAARTETVAKGICSQRLDAVWKIVVQHKVPGLHLMKGADGWRGEGSAPHPRELLLRPGDAATPRIHSRPAMSVS